METSLNEEQTTSFLRVVIFVVVSIALMIADHRLSYLEVVRTHLLALVYPIQYIVDLPVKTSQWLSVSVGGRIQLLDDNAKLRDQNLRLQVALQRFQALKKKMNVYGGC